MRCQQLLTTIEDAFNHGYINLERASVFARNDRIRGGWEVWLQLEIAHAFLHADGNWTCEREQPYPSTSQRRQFLTYSAVAGVAGTATKRNAAARADFFLHRTQGMADEAYIELKCINATRNNAVLNAWGRFEADVVKQQILTASNGNLNCISVLATFGTFNQADINSLAWFMQGGRRAYVYDVFNNNYNQNSRVTTLANVATGGLDRLFLVAVSV